MKFLVFRYHGTDGFNDVQFDWEPDTSKVQKESAISAIQRLASTYQSKFIIFKKYST